MRFQLVSPMVGLLLLSASAGAAPKPSAEAEQKGPSEREIAIKKLQKRRGFAKLQEIVKVEPSVHDVQAAAVGFYKLEPERIAKMSRAANLKALMPEIEGGIDNSVGNTYTNTRDGLYPNLNVVDANNPFGYKERTAQSTDNFLWRVRAVWNLDRLVFNPEELDVKSLSSVEENLVREVTTLFYARRRQLANLLLSPPEDEEEFYYEKLKLDELTSTLDALTGGIYEKKGWKGELEPAAAP